MAQEQWTAVDHYINETVVKPDALLDAALSSSAAAGLPAIAVSPAQGKLLHILALAIGARRILEIGTLGGYSTIWLARALPPDGRLISLEVEEKHAAIARANLARAGLGTQVEIRVGRAADSLARLIAEHAAPFDLIFIDADKPALTEYLIASLKLSRVGTLIIVDNVVRDGAVIDSQNNDPAVQGVRRLNDFLARENSLRATTPQTVGSKGYDGLTIALVTDNR